MEDAAGLVDVVAGQAGRVAEVFAQAGDRVDVDQPLLAMDDRRARLLQGLSAAELGEQRANAELAHAKLSGAQREVERARRLAQFGAATDQQVEEAATSAEMDAAAYSAAVMGAEVANAKKKLADFDVDARLIRAPTGGVVVRRHASPGSAAEAGAVLFTIAPGAAKVVRAELDEAFADAVKPGMKASVSREFTSGAPLAAHVLRISPDLSAPSIDDDRSSTTGGRVLIVTLALDATPGFRLGQRVLVRFEP